MHPPTVRFQIAIWGLPLIIPGWFHVNLFTMLFFFYLVSDKIARPWGIGQIQGLKRIPGLTPNLIYSAPGLQVTTGALRSRQIVRVVSRQAGSKVGGLLCLLASEA